jgi:carbon storage regulator
MLIETVPVLEAQGSTTHPAGVAAKVEGNSSGKDDPRPKDSKVGGLVLTRHIGQSIMIGNQVEVLITSAKAGVARLKFLAPRHVAIHRREVFEAIRDDEPAATATTMPAPVASPTPVSSLRPKVGGGLVLARSHGQSIMIGDEVELTVIEIRPSTVKLRVVAPKTVAVHRREVFDAIQGQQG